MSPERWRRAEQIYHAALELPIAERASFIKMESGSDAELRAEVESLVWWEEKDCLFAADETAETGLLPAAAAGAPALEFIPGTPFVHDEILGKVGQGGMGVVYKARDSRLGRVVAIKFLRYDAGSEQDRRERFLREARTASALNHPGIVFVYDVVSGPDTDAIVMEYVEGPTLAERISQAR